MVDLDFSIEFVVKLNSRVEFLRACSRVFSRVAIGERRAYAPYRDAATNHKAHG